MGKAASQETQTEDFANDHLMEPEGPVVATPGGGKSVHLLSSRPTTGANNSSNRRATGHVLG